MSNKTEIEKWCCHCGNHDPGKLLVVKSCKIDKGKLRAYCRVCGDDPGGRAGAVRHLTEILEHA